MGTIQQRGKIEIRPKLLTGGCERVEVHLAIAQGFENPAGQEMSERRGAHDIGLKAKTHGARIATSHSQGFTALGCSAV